MNLEACLNLGTKDKIWYGKKRRKRSHIINNDSCLQFYSSFIFDQPPVHSLHKSLSI